MVDVPYQCAEISNPLMMQKIVRVESSGNPLAIGVVGGRLERQPKNLLEAVATVKALEQLRMNYSIGISQVNRIHFSRLGWKENIAAGFDVCPNLKAGAGILNDCYNGALEAGYASSGATHVYSASEAALSCYYSGRFKGQDGYVRKVLGAVSAAVPRSNTFGKKTAFTMFD